MFRRRFLAAQPVAIDTNGNNVGFASALTGSSGSLAKYGAGMLTLATTNSYGGGTMVYGGTLQLTGSNDLSTAGNITTAGGTLDLGGFGQDTSGQITFSGGLTKNGTLNNTSSANPFLAQSGTVSAVLSGTTGLVKTLGGAMYLTASNSYTGGTTLGAGSLNITSGSALGDPNYALSFTGNATLQAGGATVALSSTRTINISASNVTATFDSKGNTMSIAGSIGGAGNATKIGTGLLILTSTNNSYAGNTTITGGTLQLGDGSANNGAVPGNMTNNATLVCANPFAQTYSGASAAMARSPRPATAC